MSTLKTLDRGLSALWAIARAPHGLTVAELAAELGVDRAIAYRVAATLELHGLINRQPDGRLLLGAAVLELERRFAPQFRAQAQPLLVGLSAETQATAFLSLAQGDNAAAILVSEPENVLIRVGYRVGSTHPLSRGAAGIAILAGRPPSDGDTDEVIEARRLGYSLTRGRLQKGAVGVASPIASLDASIGVVAMEDLDIGQAIGKVQDCAVRLAKLVGG